MKSDVLTCVLVRECSLAITHMWLQIEENRQRSRKISNKLCAHFRCLEAKGLETT